MCKPKFFLKKIYKEEIKKKQGYDRKTYQKINVEHIEGNQ